MASCLVCAASSVETFLDLGSTALANKFPNAEDLSRPEPRFPLRVGFCHGCGHVQLVERVPPAAMFTDYLYVSSASDTLRGHFDDLAGTLTARHGLADGGLVIDIGCNDASLLCCFRDRGARTLGVDPAENLAEFSRETGIERYRGFFGADTAGEIADRWGRAALVTATNTFPHIPDLSGFVAGLDAVLAPGGAFVLEAHYLVDLLDQLAFDTVYHEHVSYWALGPMMRLFADHGMEVVRAERLPIHHGQLRATVMRRGEGAVDGSVAEVLAAERQLGIDRFDTWRAFAGRVGRLKAEVMDCLNGLKAEGRRLAGYGAPAKGSTLLEFFGVGPDLLDFIADRSPLKQGRYTPGSHIPIVAPELLLEEPSPDHVLLLAWNFEEEILAQQGEFRRRGGKFILPVPEVRVV
ncbi:MAG: class I SAM-dependent methyltransferase [Holophagales bacterium]|nr:class I SAM-dependent methyltransferase [Holophagales bacterium]MYH24695.1 class I SAM-dependent methyltransferase [Holophagales bacterium]